MDDLETQMYQTSIGMTMYRAQEAILRQKEGETFTEEDADIFMRVSALFREVSRGARFIDTAIKGKPPVWDENFARMLTSFLTIASAFSVYSEGVGTTTFFRELSKTAQDYSASRRVDDERSRQFEDALSRIGRSTNRAVCSIV